MKNEPLTYEEKLHEQYEDALFALMMHNFAVQQGEKYMEENERLKQDPEAAMPEDMERRCLVTIESELNKKGRVVHIHSFKRVLTYAAAAIVLAALLVGGAIAVSDEFRVDVINFLMEMDDEKATFQFVSEEESDTLRILPTPASDSEMPDIEVAWMEEGFVASAQEKDMFRTAICYTDELGNRIEISVQSGDITTYFFDREDAERFEELTIQGYYGVETVKQDVTAIAWIDKNLNLVYSIKSSTVDSETLVQIADGITACW